MATPSNDTVPADWVPEPDTAAAALAAYAGDYESPEAETTVRVALDSSGALAVTRTSTPGGPWRLRAMYRDGFRAAPGAFVFTRDRAGRVTGFRFTTGRLRNLRFDRK